MGLEEAHVADTAHEGFTEGTRLLLDGYVDQAVEELQSAALLDGGSHPSINYNLALAYAGLGQHDAALDQLRWLVNSGHDRARLLALQTYFDLREGTYSGPTTIQDDLAGI